MNESLTNKQIVFMLFGAIVGYGAVGLPREIAEKLGTEGWIALLIGACIAIVATYIHSYLGYVHENKRLQEYSVELVGRKITTIFVIQYIILFFTFSAIVTRIASELIKNTILIYTPVWSLSLLFAVAICYAVVTGLRNIAKICEIYGFVVIIGIIFVHMMMFTQGKLINIRPFWGSKDIITYMQALPIMIIPYIGMEIISFIPINRNKNKNIIKYSMITVGIIGVIYVLMFESCMSILGVDDIIHYKDTISATIRRIEVPYLQFLRRLDGIFINGWIMSVFCTIAIYTYGSVYFISSFSKKLNFNKATIIVMIIVFIVSQIPKNIFQIEEIIKIITYFSIIPTIIIPSILFIITKVKRYDKKT